MTDYVLHHAWAFFALLGMTVFAIAGVAVLGALWLHGQHRTEMSRHADALQSLSDMHPGPRSVP